MHLQFGEFIFDSETHELLRDHQPVTLSPKAFQLLEILIENRPKALSKSQLHDRLWPNTFVVEANLSNLIGEVRRALDDDPRRPRFVRTIHRFGYAFRAETADLARSETTSVVCRLIGQAGVPCSAKAIISSDATPTRRSSSIRRACLVVMPGSASWTVTRRLRIWAARTALPWEVAERTGRFPWLMATSSSPALSS
jgi:DNA-binding winged helix-turn-helix (wHTH) protein